MRQQFKYSISELAPYINWAYFHHAWQVSDPAEQQRLRAEAEQFMQQSEGRYFAHALLWIGAANGDGDDIVIGDLRIPTLRQQQPSEANGYCLALADFIKPIFTSDTDSIGVFATTVDIGMEMDFDGDPYMRMMVQLIADRLAEAAAELLHQQVRTKIWGYAPMEQLTPAELHACKYRGIRPAVGYPSLPDTSVNFIIDHLLGLSQIGIRLTESGAMRPHASVTGLMMAHPKAHYFSVGTIGEDQLRDYARRRGLPVEVIRRFMLNVER